MGVWIVARTALASPRRTGCFATIIAHRSDLHAMTTSFGVTATKPSVAWTSSPAIVYHRDSRRCCHRVARFAQIDPYGDARTIAASRARTRSFCDGEVREHGKDSVVGLLPSPTSVSSSSARISFGKFEWSSCFRAFVANVGVTNEQDAPVEATPEGTVSGARGSVRCGAATGGSCAAERAG